MIRLFTSRSFGTRILLAMCLASATAVGLTCLLLVPMQFSRKTELTEAHLLTKARIVALHSTAALSFRDALAGTETLAALQGAPEIGGAAIYDANGELFAIYRRPNQQTPLGLIKSESPMRIDDWYILPQPIVHDGNRLGTLIMAYHLAPLHAQLWRDVTGALLAAMASFLVAALLALSLRRLLARPLAELAATAHVIAETGNYAARARRYGDDELGKFTDVFNQMLGRIEVQGEQIRQTNEELRQRNHEMQQFVYTVSHDLKSPLVTISGFVGLLQQDVAEGRYDDVIDSTEHLARASAKMSELIDDLLQLSRIGRMPNDLQPLDVEAVIRDVARDLESQLDQAGARLEIDPAMPPVIADRLRLTQVFDNLLTNAIKYGCDGEDPAIRVGGKVEGDEVRFFVQDDGPGIASQYHERIFGLFQRLDNKAQGTGVGLAIVMRIIESHGGRVWVDSSPGHGATFWIALPLRSTHTRPGAEAMSFSKGP